MVKVRNCIRCGQLFEAITAEICPDCFHSAQEQEERVFHFLRQNGGHGTLEQISSATGVPRSVVVTMAKRGWFQGEFSINYPCERCGIRIEEGRLCSACVRFIREEVRKLEPSIASKNDIRRFYSRPGEKE